ncbi:MAG: nitroreductase family protein [Ktedonobacterales bacterium]
MEFHEILKRRKSVRSYEQQPVPRDVLDRVLASVIHAPSAGFTQGNEFLVLDDPDAVSDFWTLTADPADPMTPEQRQLLAPVLILPLANRRAYLDRYSQPDKAAAGMQQAESWPVPYWDIDAGMASMLILLAAVDEGLGAWFFGIASGERAVLDRFGIPDQFKPIGVIALGYPAPRDPASAVASPTRIPRRPVETLLHRNGW